MAEKNIKVTAASIRKYIGKEIFIEQANGKRVEGKLVAIKNGKAYIKPLATKRSNKPVKTSFFFIAAFIIGIIAIVGIGLLLWCACCGARVNNRGCGCGCRQRPYRAKRPYRYHRRAAYRRRYA